MAPGTIRTIVTGKPGLTKRLLQSKFRTRKRKTYGITCVGIYPTNYRQWTCGSKKAWEAIPPVCGKATSECQTGGSPFWIIKPRRSGIAASACVAGGVIDGKTVDCGGVTLGVSCKSDAEGQPAVLSLKNGAVV